MRYEILKQDIKPFTTDEGEQMDYYWYKAIREHDEVTIRFGSTNGDYSVGDSYEIDLEKYERKDGNTGYKEVRKK